MKKRILFIVILAFLAGLFFAVNKSLFTTSPTAYAVGDLTVDWGIGVGDVGPIFVVNDMAPGDMEQRVVHVSNGAVTARPVGVRGIKTSEIASLSAVMDMVISENGTDLYGGTSPTGPKTLEEFFTESAGPDGVPLSTLAPGATTNYTFEVTFQESAGNAFQNANVMFDLKIGIAIAVPEECQGLEFDLIDGLPTFGTDGNDKIKGTSGNDLIFALEGDDHVAGGLGNDCIVGGDGKDHLEGGIGEDHLFGNAGNDTLLGGKQNDFIQGGEGDDEIEGGIGKDIILGGQGNDRIDGGNNDDILHGDSGNDTIRGGNGNDDIQGGDGTDSGNGGNGEDQCDAELETNCEF